MPTKPKIFFDTSLCIDIARKIPADEWSKVSNRVFRKFRYFISPLTVYELVAGLASADERHFIQNQEAIRAVYPTGPKTFLPLLRAFIPAQLFRERVMVPPSIDTDFKLWVKVILKARSRKELESGKLGIGIKGRKGFGILLDGVNSQMRVIEDGFAGLLSFFRRTKAPTLTPDVWAKLILDAMCKPNTRENLHLVLDRLDAAYRFESRLWSFIEQSNYNFSKHRSELVDSHQLTYLCDSEMCFATSDKRLKKTVAESPQCARILTYEELRQL
jgi:hypothetical protein